MCVCVYVCGCVWMCVDVCMYVCASCYVCIYVSMTVCMGGVRVRFEAGALVKDLITDLSTVFRQSKINY